MYVDNDDISRDTENFFRYKLSHYLNLSESKDVAMQRVFYHFSDIVKRSKVDPKSMRILLDDIEVKLKKVSTWQKPKGSVIIQEKDLSPSGRPYYRLITK